MTAANKGRKLFKIVLRIVLLIFFIGILWYTVDLDDVVTLLRNISLFHILSALFIYFMIYVLRAYRYKIMYANVMNIEWRVALRISFMHGFFNRVLPARVGELSYIFMLKKEKKVSLSTSAVSLLVLRLYDLFICAIVFLIGVTGSPLRSNRQLLLVAVLIVVLMVIVLLFLPKLLILLNRFISKYSLFRGKFSFEEEAIDGFFASAIKARLFLVSSLIWLATYAVFMVLIAGFGLDLSILESAFAITMAVVTNLLPISGIGGFGTMELGWTFGFMYLDVEYSVALSSGVMSNLFTFMATILFGIIGLLIKTNREKTGGQNETHHPNPVSE